MATITSISSRISTVGRLVATVLVGCAAAIAVPGIAAADAVRADQWQLRALDADNAWTLAKGADVTVAVVDSGVDASHPDLAGQVLPGIDLVDPGGNGQRDPVGHGTAIAAFIAGRSDDQNGVVGLAPQAKILPVRVLDANNRYDDSVVVAEGVQWAVDHGAQVVNLSLGGSYSTALADALDYAFARDVVVVACAGNVAPGGPAEIWYPAREPGVIAVAGTGRSLAVPDPLWSGSLTGPATVLLAPATDMLAAYPEGRYRAVEGTSFAAPMVSAAAALIRSRFPHISAANVVERLTTTARDLGVPGRDDRYGFGIVDPVAALQDPVAEVSTNPLDNADPPPGIAGFGPADDVPEIVSPLDGSPTSPPARPRLLPAEDVFPAGPQPDDADRATGPASRYSSRRTVDIAQAQSHG